MRLSSEAKHLETIGVEEEQDFKIKANAKAFRMLIDGLYSDKIGSMVRELATNAYDSQLSACYDGTFYINVPNMTRPEFYVRDYGVGMDHAKVMHLYSTLFESDKDETDDLVGAFGLGSKSPFAYADQFSLSCYDGERVRHYTAAIGVNGTPKIMLQGTEDCAEPRGVRVTVAVEPKDFQAFEKAVRNIALGFEPMFDSNIELAGLGTAQFEGKDGTWAAYEGSALPATWNIRQGCVIYPLASKSGLALQNDSGRKWLITVPIGSVEPVPSREEIQYRPRRSNSSTTRSPPSSPRSRT
uniref:RIIA protein n=1 Tax=Caulobacter phage BL57 TaxID=3348355 RepID=A0AB74UNC4_9VIRU